MVTFSVTPVGPFPPEADQDFPDYIQFQWNGVNLGGPDADTVNFVGSGLTVVRGGSGTDENTITITFG